MRIIAGTAGGIRLECPQDVARPMMDRVRAAVFSRLGERVPGARVLDLFAGSGAIGLEALSRGAASAVFVDQHRAASAAIRANLLRARLEGTICPAEVGAFLRSQRHPGPFDLVFADPPFALDRASPAHPAAWLRHDALGPLVAGDALLVVELPEPPPLESPFWEALDPRRYGQAWVGIYRRRVAP